MCNEFLQYLQSNLLDILLGQSHRGRHTLSCHSLVHGTGSDSTPSLFLRGVCQLDF